MTMVIPEALPTLAKGGHHPGDGQACVMEYVSVLAGEAWSDKPKCTHPRIGMVARALNDNMYDSHRHLLIPLIPRLLVANVEGETYQRAVEVGLDHWIKQQYDDKQMSVFERLCTICHSYHEQKTGVSPDQIVVSILARGSADEQVALLTGLLDEFDRLTQRDRARPIDPIRMTRAVYRVEGKPLPKTIAVAKNPTFKAKAVAVMDKAGWKWLAASVTAVPVWHEEEAKPVANSMSE